MDNKKPSVSVVTVTFNRLEKLKHTLACFDNQTAAFDNLIVVDNCSTDGTREFLEQWRLQKSSFTKHVISLDRNTGGSGGFYEGEKYALTLNPDWIYIADDDAYPAPDMIESFYNFESRFRNERLAAICSVVLYPDGTINTGCRAKYCVKNNAYILDFVSEKEYERPYFEFNNLSYVGAFLSSGALREVGLVNKDFFIYQDDSEHSIRLSSFGRFLCCPNIVVIHDEPQVVPSEIINKILWKEYYAHRNFAYMLLEHYPKAGRKFIFQELFNTNIRKSSSFSAVQRMKLEGIKDALCGRLGMHKIYKPGLDCMVYTKLPYPKTIWRIIYPFFRLSKIIVKIWI